MLIYEVKPVNNRAFDIILEGTSMYKLAVLDMRRSSVWYTIQTCHIVVVHGDIYRSCWHLVHYRNYVTCIAGNRIGPRIFGVCFERILPCHRITKPRVYLTNWIFVVIGTFYQRRLRWQMLLDYIPERRYIWTMCDCSWITTRLIQEVPCHPTLVRHTEHQQISSTH